MISVNQQAMRLVRHILAAPQRLGARVHVLGNGSTLIDLGQEAPGGWLAGRYLARICLGGLARVNFEPYDLAGHTLTAVRVSTQHPLAACLGAQIAGWQLEPLGQPDALILSGPVRALNHACPDPYLELAGYRDEAREGVAVLQTARAVTPEIAAEIARACRLAPEDLYILVAPNNSLACAVQVSARILEQALHRLAEEGYDVRTVCRAEGVCVVPPPAADDLCAMGRLNDALLYGGTAHLTVRASDEAVAEVIARVPTSASSAYGRPFAEIYLDAARDFYSIPLEVHSPAVLHMTNLNSGRVVTAGELNPGVLCRSFFG
jgi:methenyltetrahydromethanopterin cyclohydrolase